MALTAEQQSQVELQTALAQLNADAENARRAHELAMDARRSKLEAVRIAKETLIENRRNQPVDAREVTAADIAAYATTLVNYVNS